MRKLWIPTLCLLSCAGCSGMSSTGKGALLGGAGGGLLGAGIGRAAGNTTAGALIGTGLGAVVGAGVGNDIDRENKRAKQAAAAAALNPPMSMQDVVYMAQRHTSDDLIIGQIERSNSTFCLRPQDVVYLTSQGVSDRVGCYMQARRAAAVVPVVRPVERVVVVEEPPPVAVGVGIYGGGPRC